MSEFAQFAGNPAPEEAKPPRPTIGYADLLAVRLRRLAAGRSTGILPFAGRSDGAIYLQAGRVVGAESSRSPRFPVASPQATSSQASSAQASSAQVDPTAGASEPFAPDGTSPADPSLNGGRATGSGAVAKATVAKATVAKATVAKAGKRDSDLLAPLLRVEPAIDAVLDLVLSQSSIGRFRTGKARSGPEPISLSADSLVTEIARRLHLVRQMAAVVTADTTVFRSPRLHSARVQVSALQWALLIRAGTATTPRTLAWALGCSVFGTTTEAYRLIALDLLLVADQAGLAPDLAQRDALGLLEPCPGTISFLRAVSDQKGDNGMSKLSDLLDHAGGGR